MDQTCSIKYIQVPDGTGLINRPVNLNGWSTRRGARDRVVGVAVMKNSSGSQDLSSETGGNNYVVILRGLISCK